MTDLFLAREGTPARIVAGDSVAFLRCDIFAAYMPPDHVLDYVFSPQDGGETVTVGAIAEAGAWRVVLSSDLTADLPPGVWAWAAMVGKTGGARATYDQGELTIAPNPTAGGDSRSAAARVLAAIEDAIAGRASKDVESYTIEGRSLTRMPMVDLLRLRNIYTRKVRQEAGNGSGFGRSRRVAI